MLEVLIPTDLRFKFYEKEIKKLYEENQSKICDDSSFEFVRDNTFFYLFLYNEKIVGAIYYFEIDNKLWVNAFSGRKTHFLNMECFELSTTWFDCDIWAEAQNRASVICLVRLGFKRVRENIFVKKKGI